MENLDGDVAIVLEVVRKIDDGHATLTESVLDAIPLGEAAANRAATSVMKPYGAHYHASTGSEVHVMCS